jgi:hypothetical protein
VGMMADRIDIAPALMIIGLVPLGAAACAAPLPGGRLPLHTNPRTDRMPEPTPFASD